MALEDSESRSLFRRANCSNLSNYSQQAWIFPEITTDSDSFCLLSQRNTALSGPLRHKQDFEVIVELIKVTIGYSEAKAGIVRIVRVWRQDDEKNAIPSLTLLKSFFYLRIASKLFPMQSENNTVVKRSVFSAGIFSEGENMLQDPHDRTQYAQGNRRITSQNRGWEDRSNSDHSQ